MANDLLTNQEDEEVYYGTTNDGPQESWIKELAFIHTT